MDNRTENEKVNIYCTDTEAGFGVLGTIINRAKTKGFSSGFIFGGDICDKGPDSIKDTYRVVGTSEFEAHIAGNRDLNKPRLLEVYSQAFVDQFGSSPFDQAPFWATAEGNKPSTFLESLDLSEEAYRALDHEDKQVIVAKWILAKTMGAAEAFRFKKQELSALLGTPVGTLDDKIVLRFFIDEITTDAQRELLATKGLLIGETVKPPNYDSIVPPYQGQMYTYLKTGKLVHIDGVNLYAHAVFSEERFPILLSGETVSQAEDETPREHFMRWANAINEEYQQNLEVYYQTAFDNLAASSTSRLVTAEHGIERHNLVLTGLPNSDINPNAIVSSNAPSRVLANNNDARATFMPLSMILSQSGFKAFYTGHNPQVQTMPVYRQIGDVDFVNCDTGRPPLSAVPAFSINFANGQHITVSGPLEADSRRYPNLGKEIILDGVQYLINAVTLPRTSTEVPSYVLIQQVVVSPGFNTDAARHGRLKAEARSPR